MAGELAAGLLERWRAEPALRRFVDRILDRRDREGRFPGSLVHRASAQDRVSLERLLPPAVVRRGADGALHVSLDRLAALLADEARDHGQAPVALEELLDRIAGRSPRNLRVEEERRRADVLGALESAFSAGREAAFARRGSEVDEFVEALCAEALAETGADRGTFAGLARGSGVAAMAEAARTLVAALLLVRGRRDGPVRLDDLSRWVCGHTKALRPGTDDHARLADALYERDPELRAAADAGAPGSIASRRRLVLEAADVVVNEGSLDVLVRGPLVLELGGDRFEDAGRLARHGVAARVTLGAIQAAGSVSTTAELVTTVENESAFHAFGVAAGADRELVVYTAGQASWAVVRLLRALGRSSPAARFRHCGDLDRSGLLILRSLRRRTGLAIAPHRMDAETFQACRDLALPMSRAEHDEVARLRATWSEDYGLDLLEALAEHRMWIEQEGVIERLGS